MAQEQPYSHTVYVLGAGFNRAVTQHAELAYGYNRITNEGVRWQAPLATNFFQLAIEQELWWDRVRGHRLTELLDYIRRFFRLTEADLGTVPLDLEECFSLMQMQAEDAVGTDSYERLTRLQESLVGLFAAYLDEYSEFAAGGAMSHDPGVPMNGPTVGERFARTVFLDDATVLTLNYDTILEGMLEAASGGVSSRQLPREWEDPSHRDAAPESVPKSLLTFSPTRWSRLCAYGFRFAEMDVRYPFARCPRIPGRIFYAEAANDLYPPRLIKLHGSVEWFRYVARDRLPGGFAADNRLEPPFEARDVIHRTRGWWDIDPNRARRDWPLEPVIIPPTLVKSYREPPMPVLREQAFAALRACSQLVVIGYSFPPTDYSIRQLFREAFALHRPDRVVCVNPVGEARLRLQDLVGRDLVVVRRESLDELDEDLLHNAPAGPTQDELVTMTDEERIADHARRAAAGDRWFAPWNDPRYRA